MIIWYMFGITNISYICTYVKRDTYLYRSIIRIDGVTHVNNMTIQTIRNLDIRNIS